MGILLDKFEERYEHSRNGKLNDLSARNLIILKEEYRRSVHFLGIMIGRVSLAKTSISNIMYFPSLSL